MSLVPKLGAGRIRPTTDGVAQDAQDAARLVAASYEYDARPLDLRAAVEKHVTPELTARYGIVDAELSSRNVLVFANAQGETTLAFRGTVSAREWGFDARDIALGAREEGSAFFNATYYDTARKVRMKYGSLPELVVGHSLGGNAAIRTVERGLAKRSVTLNPFVRPSSVGAGDHAIYRHADDPALLSFESITRSERATTLALGQAGENTRIHVIPRADVRSSFDPVHAHSVDRFVDQPLPSAAAAVTERTPLLGAKPATGAARSALSGSRVGRAAVSLGDTEHSAGKPHTHTRSKAAAAPRRRRHRDRAKSGLQK
jgi:hypothetical protein